MCKCKKKLKFELREKSDELRELKIERKQLNNKIKKLEEELLVVRKAFWKEVIERD